MFVTKTLRSMKPVISQQVGKCKYMIYFTGITSLAYIHPVLGLAGIWIINTELTPNDTRSVNTRLDKIKAKCDVEYYLCFQKNITSHLGTYNENNPY
jgi:hypothetical protein